MPTDTPKPDHDCPHAGNVPAMQCAWCYVAEIQADRDDWRNDSEQGAEIIAELKAERDELRKERDGWRERYKARGDELDAIYENASTDERIDERLAECEAAYAGLKAAYNERARERDRLREERDALQTTIGTIDFHVSRVYDHVTGGRISKPNTDEAVVRAVHDDAVAELVREAVAEETEALQGRLNAALGDAAKLRAELKTVASQCPTCHGVGEYIHYFDTYHRFYDPKEGASKVRKCLDRRCTTTRAALAGTTEADAP